MWRKQLEGEGAREREREWERENARESGRVRDRQRDREIDDSSLIYFFMHFCIFVFLHHNKNYITYKYN